MSSQGERNPPQSIETEQALLGTLLNNPAKVHDVAAVLDRDDFYQRSHSIIWNAVVTLTYSEGGCDGVTVGNYLSTKGQLDEVGGRVYLATLTADRAGIPSMVKRYAREIRDQARRRALIELSAVVQKKAYDASVPVDELVGDTFSGVMSQFQNVSRHDPELIGSGLATVRGRVEDASRQKRRWSGLDSGFYNVNEATNGFCNGELTILGARPGVGKTRFAMQCSRNIVERGDGTVFVVSLEMNRYQLAEYLICLEGDLDHRKFRRGDLTPDEWNTYGQIEKQVSEWSLVIDDTPGLTIPELYSTTERVRRQHKDLCMVVIDYIQLMRGQGDSQVAVMDRIMRELKDYKKQFDLPVLALSQCGRGVDARPDRRPCMADLRDSGQIEANGDNILMLWRISAYPDLVQRMGQQFSTHAKIVADKLRFGAPGEIELQWEPRRAKFVNPYRH